MGFLRKKMSIAVLCAALIGASVGGCAPKAAQEAQVQATKVQTQAASRGALDLTSTYIGTVAPHNSVDVTPLVSGTVKSVQVKVGDKVKEGDVLCRFDDTAADLQLKSAKNQVESARAGKEAAEDQIHAAKKQADASITSMEGQIKTLRAQRKASEDQLARLKEGIAPLKEASEAAAEAYGAARKVYDSANALYIQYQAFLHANPDCQTTAGLTAASIPVVTTKSLPGSANLRAPAPAAISVSAASGTAIGDISTSAADLGDTDISDGDKAADDAGQADADASGRGEDGEDEDEEDEDDSAASSGGSGSGGAPAADPASAEKQKTAAALVKALGKIPLTVEYLTEAGLSALKDQAEKAEEASESAAASYAQAQSSLAQLESGIAQIKAQIDALEDNIDAAEDAADAAGGTEAYDAQIKAAQTGVESAQYQKDLYTVTSPIDGIVEAVNVTADEIAAQGYPAFTISDKDAMEVSFYVPEDVRDYLKAGDEVLVEGGKEGNGGDKPVKGRISLIGTAVDAQKGLFKVIAEITQVTDKEFLSNTSVSLSLVTNSVKNQILIPFDAVYYDDDQAYVFVAERGGASADGADGAGNKEDKEDKEDSGSEEGAVQARAVRRDVRTGLYNNDLIAITEGLSEGDEVITTWGAGLKDGAPVQIIAGDA